MKRLLLLAALACYLVFAGTAAASVTTTAFLGCLAGENGHITWHVTITGAYTERAIYKKPDGTNVPSTVTYVHQLYPGYIYFTIYKATGLKVWSGSITGPGRATIAYAYCSTS